ncbi:MAG TPA: hypothetical protein VHL14_08770 [Steroidobacteraceae bacterium]|nr:hypothetical protein [Steroidobacteraceae bacterium]
MKRIALIGDHSDKIVAHRAIPLALRMAAEALSVDVRWDWLPTATLDSPIDDHLCDYAGVWVVPGSPYKNTRGALDAIRHARTRSLPFLGTCGGFQHAVMEYAEAVWKIEAMHAESTPDAIDPVIAPLMCSLIEVTDQLNFVKGSRLQIIYARDNAHEEYQCRFGLNPIYAKRYDTGAMKVTAHDAEGSIRAIELDNHPFFIATLFQPERVALKDQLPVLIKAFVQAVASSS